MKFKDFIQKLASVLRAGSSKEAFTRKIDVKHIQKTTRPDDSERVVFIGCNDVVFSESLNL